MRGREDFSEGVAAEEAAGEEQDSLSSDGEEDPLTSEDEDGSSSSSSSSSSEEEAEEEEAEEQEEMMEDGEEPQEVEEEEVVEVEEAEVEAVAVENAVPASVHTWCEDPTHSHYRRSYQYQVSSQGHGIGSKLTSLCSKIGRRLGKKTAPVSDLNVNMPFLRVVHPNSDATPRGILAAANGFVSMAQRDV